MEPLTSDQSHKIIINATEYRNFTLIEYLVENKHYTDISYLLHSVCRLSDEIGDISYQVIQFLVDHIKKNCLIIDNFADIIILSKLRSQDKLNYLIDCGISYTTNHLQDIMLAIFQDNTQQAMDLISNYEQKNNLEILFVACRKNNYQLLEFSVRME